VDVRAEYQARGVAHLHSVIRLDAPDEDYQPPPPASMPSYCAMPSGHGASSSRSHLPIRCATVFT